MIKLTTFDDMSPTSVGHAVGKEEFQKEDSIVTELAGIADSSLFASIKRVLANCFFYTTENRDMNESHRPK